MGSIAYARGGGRGCGSSGGGGGGGGVAVGTQAATELRVELVIGDVLVLQLQHVDERQCSAAVGALHYRVHDLRTNTLQHDRHANKSKTDKIHAVKLLKCNPTQFMLL